MLQSISHSHSKLSEVYFLQVWVCEDHRNGDEAKDRCNLTQSSKECWGKLLPGEANLPQYNNIICLLCESDNIIDALYVRTVYLYYPEL